MQNANAHLCHDLFNTDTLRKAPTRDGFGKGVVEAGEENKNIVVLCADLAESTRAEVFKNAFPERYIEVGVAEQNMAALAAGFAAGGKIPFITSYAAFSPGRNYEQIRTTACLNAMPVKICGMHAGISVGPDGATHQMLEDIALMRVLPHMTVLSPTDAEEARKATRAAAKIDGPVYLRFSRSATPVFTTAETPFDVGKANILFESEDPQVLIVATGPLVYEALLAVRMLEEKNIGSIVLNMHTIKPLDTDTLMRYAPQVVGVVTVEEHQVVCGMGGAIAEFFAREYPLPMRFIGVHNEFGQSGEPEELKKFYEMDSLAISDAVYDILKHSSLS